MKPLHTHDCASCRFIANTPGKDWYIHDTGAGPGTIIGRHSSDGPDYDSWPISLIDEGTDEVHVIPGNAPSYPAFSESKILARYMLNVWRMRPKPNYEMTPEELGKLRAIHSGMTHGTQPPAYFAPRILAICEAIEERQP